MATQSMPTVLWRSIRKAIFSLVPTPSVPLTSTGFRMPVRSREKRPPKPPMSEATEEVMVRAMWDFISSTAR